ncbi:MAG: carboxypeptidase regulatory-like domain-containing protein [Leptolyngbya sp. DLM2.Bin15]|nr:MAG: carboxypeptidase regulatory-like domain-containing protein [Leptolyngbya sp. DLM2.Bin15]
MQLNPPRWLVLPLVALSSGAIALPALSHGTAVEYEVGTAVAVSALYDTGEPMAQAQVAVFTPDDPTTPWLTGTTDLDGTFLFMPDPAIPGNWEVQVRQAGHGEILVIPMAAPTATSEAPAEMGGEESAEVPVDGAEVAEAIAMAAPSSSPQRSSAALSPVQRWTMIGAIIWGFVGTAFFFSPRKPVSDPAGEA